MSSMYACLKVVLQKCMCGVNGCNEGGGSNGKPQEGAVDMHHATSVEEIRTRAPRATTPSKGFLHFENPLVIIIHYTILY
jgi:hypothetical protein